MPVISKPKNRGPLFGGRAVIMFSKCGTLARAEKSGTKTPDQEVDSKRSKKPKNRIEK